ncbi:MAG: FAD:protein FMN transferase [Minisyncoccia bacterium]
MTGYKFEAIGTHWEIEIKDELSKEEESSLFRRIMDRIELFDKDYSRFRDDSLVLKISKKSGIYKMPKDFSEMISLYKKAYDLTGGLVTPLIGNVLVDSGYDSKYSLVKKEMTKPKSWDEVIKWDGVNLNIREPVVLDFGACGKGYLVDIVSEIIEKDGIKSYVVDASGDMRQRNNEDNELRVGLEHPEDKEKVIGIVKIKNQSLCGSAGNRRKWADMHHIINPETLTSPTHILSVWVVAETTILSDILTTCLFFTKPEVLQSDFRFEYLILNSDYSVTKSDIFDVELFR